MNNYLEHLTKSFAASKELNPQEEAQNALEKFRKTGALTVKIHKTKDDRYNLVRFFDHVPFHLADVAGADLVQDAYRLVTMTRINILVQEIKRNLAAHCELSKVESLPANIDELLDKIPEEFTKLFMRFVFGDLSDKLPSETEYYRLYPNGLPELHYENQCALQVAILFDDNREDLSIIDNFGFSVLALKFHAKEGHENLSQEIFAQFHEDTGK